MDLEQAIRTALEYEGRVYKTYMMAKEAATDDIGKRVFSTLCDEEKGHLDYLRERLHEWQQTGAITVASLETAIPSRDEIEQGVGKLREKVADAPSAKHTHEIELLKQALQVEVETSTFYREMVRTLDADGQELFARFVEIEEGHQAIVQAELDCVSGMGFWFDTREFSLEM